VKGMGIAATPSEATHLRGRWAQRAAARHAGGRGPRVDKEDDSWDWKCDRPPFSPAFRTRSGSLAKLPGFFLRPLGFSSGLRTTVVPSLLLARAPLFRAWMFRIRHTWLLRHADQQRTALAV
jgi:hypothetical protein